MPYFFILPAYIFLVLGLSIAAIILRFIPQARWATGYLVGGIIGTMPGFLIANVLVTGAGFLPMWAAQKGSIRGTPGAAAEAARVFGLSVLLVGPFIASAVGICLGFAGGVYFVFKRRRRAEALRRICA